MGDTLNNPLIRPIGIAEVPLDSHDSLGFSTRYVDDLIWRGTVEKSR